MAALWLLLGTGLLMLGAGLWYALVPLDVLWRQQERSLMARGLAPSRNAVWGKSARRGAGVLIFLGAVIALGMAVLLASAPPKMSGVSINGRELTQQEWGGCGRDTPTCLTREYMKTHGR